MLHICGPVLGGDPEVLHRVLLVHTGCGIAAARLRAELIPARSSAPIEEWLVYSAAREG